MEKKELNWLQEQIQTQERQIEAQKEAIRELKGTIELLESQNHTLNETVDTITNAFLGDASSYKETFNPQRPAQSAGEWSARYLADLFWRQVFTGCQAEAVYRSRTCRTENTSFPEEDQIQHRCAIVQYAEKIPVRDD